MKPLWDGHEEWIREHLEALEDEILKAYAARVQFALNRDKVYLERDGSGMSYLESFLRDIEVACAKRGRYEVPEERPFSQGLPTPEERIHIVDHGLRVQDYVAINFTEQIMQRYIDFLPRVCRKRDDGDYGSSAWYDIDALAMTSQRIHFGMYVAEWKFRQNPDKYVPLILAADSAGLEAAITDEGVERRVRERVFRKADQSAKATNLAVRAAIDPDVFTEFFMNTIVYLTKQVQVAYLLKLRSQLGQ